MENLQHQFNRYFVDNGATEWWLTGLKTTLLVTVIALCIGVVLGLLIALIRSTHEQTGKLKLPYQRKSPSGPGSCSPPVSGPTG